MWSHERDQEQESEPSAPEQEREPGEDDGDVPVLTHPKPIPRRKAPPEAGKRPDEKQDVHTSSGDASNGVHTCQCGRQMVIRSARNGARFLSCTGYSESPPACKRTRPLAGEAGKPQPARRGDPRYADAPVPGEGAAKKQYGPRAPSWRERYAECERCHDAPGTPQADGRAICTRCLRVAAAIGGTQRLEVDGRRVDPVRAAVIEMQHDGEPISPVIVAMMKHAYEGTLGARLADGTPEEKLAEEVEIPELRQGSLFGA